MARSAAEALLLRLLLALCAATGATAAVHGCQPEVLVSTVSLPCARRLPTEWFCLALAHAARVGGVARCLCRLAPERPLVRAGLNATDLLRLHAACAARGRSRGDGGAAHPPPACDGEGAPVAAAAAPRDTTGCAPAALADQMELFCGRSSPNGPCFLAVVGSARMGADGLPCLCHAALSSASFDVARVAALYGA